MALTKIDILKSFKYIQTLELSDNALEGKQYIYMNVIN